MLLELIKEIDPVTIFKLFAEFIVSLAGVITAAIVIYKYYRKATLKMLEKEFEDMKEKIEAVQTNNDKKIDELQADINKRLDDVEAKQEESAIEACKNFLTHAMTDIKNGADDEVLKERVHDAHKWYNDHNQNSFIDTRFNELVKEGKL